jgi:hypothetical protein
LTGANALAANSVLALPYPDLPTGQSDLGAIAISIATLAVATPQTCAAALAPPPEGGTSTPPAAEVSIIVATNDLTDGGPKVGPGIYPVHLSPTDADGGPNASITWTTAGSTFATSKGGSVTVSQFGATFVSGQFSTTLVALDGGQSPLSGTFDASYCGP